MLYQNVHRNISSHKIDWLCIWFPTKVIRTVMSKLKIAGTSIAHQRKFFLLCLIALTSVPIQIWMITGQVLLDWPKLTNYRSGHVSFLWPMLGHRSGWFIDLKLILPELIFYFLAIKLTHIKLMRQYLCMIYNGKKVYSTEVPK